MTRDPVPLGPRPSKIASPRAIDSSLFQRLIAPETSEPERIALLRRLERVPWTPEVLHAWATMLRRRAIPFPVPRGDRTLDLCGTGGARLPSFNVSTVSALVVATAGVPVVKHGNRSARGLTGSSDLLDAWGLPILRSRDFARESYRRYRIAFLHAPLYHPSMKAVASARRALGRRTAFNLMGPLINPVRPTYQLVGAPDARTADILAQALRLRRVRRVLGLSSPEGCDEISPHHPTQATVRIEDRRRGILLLPDQLLTPSERRGSWAPLPPRQAARAADRILEGALGARRGAVLLTSATALWLAQRVATLEEGVEQARELLDHGDAAMLRDRLKALAHESDWPEVDA
jgi:anthranilate phosphoribosyltransferase